MSFNISLKKQQELQGISTLALMGSVAAGKTSICKLLTGGTTQKHSAELVNGCTIKMGYKNLKIYYNGQNFITNPRVVPENYELVRHFSIADNPGHNSFMATLVTGISAIDNAIFLVSGTHGIEPQTHQHMKCFKSTEINNMAVIISKVDLIPTEQKLREIMHQVDKFMENENLNEDIDPPIIPLSSFSKINTNYLIKYLVSQQYPKNIGNLVLKDFNMMVVRSFDINKPGTSIDKIEGAVFGGAINNGYLAVGDVICILPGNIRYEEEGKIIYTPLVTQVVGLRSDTANMEVALPGGFIAIKTTLDPFYGKSDKMVGNLIIKVNSKEDIATKCNISNYIEVSNLVVLNDQELKEGSEYLVVVHASGQMAILESIDSEIYKFRLNVPIALLDKEKVAILTKNGNAGSIEMLSYGIITFSSSNESIQLNYQDDIDEFFDTLPIEQKIKSITLTNDLKVFDDFEKYNDELYNTDHMIDKIAFEKKKFAINCPSIILDKDTTSVSITNANIIAKLFTKDNEIAVQICHELASFIITSYGDDMKTARPHVSNEMITFHSVKRGNRKFYTSDFNKKLDQFVTGRFTCKTCNTIGSMFFEKKKHYCRACNAVSMTKDIKEKHIIVEETGILEVAREL